MDTLNGHSTLSSTTSSELPADSEFLQVTTSSLEDTAKSTDQRPKSTGTVLPEKYLLGKTNFAML